MQAVVVLGILLWVGLGLLVIATVILGYFAFATGTAALSVKATLEPKVRALANKGKGLATKSLRIVAERKPQLMALRPKLETLRGHLLSSSQNLRSAGRTLRVATRWSKPFRRAAGVARTLIEEKVDEV